MSRLLDDRVADHDSDAVYARSPLTAAEEALQFMPGSRFLNTAEFKRIYLSDGALSTHPRTRPVAAASPGEDGTERYSSARGARGTAVPHRPPSSPAAYSRKGLAARRLYCRPASAASPPPQRTHSRTAARVAVDPSVVSAPPPATAAAATLASSDTVVQDALHHHPSLSQQLRRKVRAARCSPSVHYHHPPQPLSGRGERAEDAWLALQRELADSKAEVRSLQRQLRHAQVLVRTLHGVSRDDEADKRGHSTESSVQVDRLLGDGDTPATEDAAAGDASAEAVATRGQGTNAAPVESERKEYWQRRAFFLSKQHEALAAEVERLRRDARGSKVRALVKELEVVREQLRRSRQPPHGTAASGQPTPAVTEVDTGEDGEVRGEGEAGRVVAGPVARRWLPMSSTSHATAVDERFLREKDDLIGELRERLRLLTQQYQTADAQLMASMRQVEDLTHRYTAVQAEWRALQHLPQELARVQQQLHAAQARLLESDREVEAFHQLFDTLESPATLRAVMEERDHLVELLRQSQQQQAAVRDEMKAAQQQAVSAVEARYRTQREEAQAMARDREAQQAETIRQLTAQVAALRREMAAQQAAFEAELLEQAAARDADLTERLLDSVAHGPVEEEGNHRTASEHRSTAKESPSLRASPQSMTLPSRPTSRGGPQSASPAAAAAVATVLPAGASVDSSSASETLQTYPPAHPSTDALVAPGGGDRSAGAQAAPVPQPASPSAPAAPLVGDDTDSSLTPTSDSMVSPDDTFTETDDEDDSEAEAGLAVRPPSSTVAPPAAGAASASSDRQEGPPHATAPVATALDVRQELVSSEEVSEDEATSHVTSEKDSSGSQDGIHDADTSGEEEEDTTDSDEEAFNGTVEKMEHQLSDSSSEPTTPVRVPGEMRIGFGFNMKPRTSASASPAPPPAPDTAAEGHRGHVFDFLPSPPIAIARPVSILIDRSAADELSFTRNLRAVVHSPNTSPQQTGTATSDPTQSQTATSSVASEEDSSTSRSDSLSESSSTAATPLAPTPPTQPAGREAEATEAVVGGEGAVDAAMAAEANSAAAEEAAEEAAPSGESSVNSGSQEAAVPLQSQSPMPIRSVQLPTHSLLPPAAPSPPPSPSAANGLQTSLSAPETAAEQADPSSPPPPATAAVPVLHASAVSSPAVLPLGGRAAPIPSPPAITPLVASNLYPRRPSSLHLQPPQNVDDGFGDGSGATPRGGASPQLGHFDQNSSFEAGHAFSGNASFDFVGPLAERHRLEDMQGNVVLSLQSSPATQQTSAAAGAAAFPSAAPGHNAGRPAISTGAAGLRKTPSPPLLPEARQPSTAVLPSPHTSPTRVAAAEGGEAAMPAAAEDSSLSLNVASSDPVPPAAVSTISAAVSDVNQSPIPQASPPDPTLLSFALSEVAAGAPQDGAADDDDEPPAFPEPSQEREDEERREGAGGGQVQAAAPFPPLPPMVPVPSPPPAAGGVPLPPQVTVPPPPQVIVPLPPQVTVPPPPQVVVPLPPSAPSPAVTDAASEEDQPAVPVAVTVAQHTVENALSLSSSGPDAHTLSGADMEEEEEEEGGDEDSARSDPPMVVGGTVEKTSSPVERRPLDDWTKFETRFSASPAQVETTAPRYSVSAAASLRQSEEEEGQEQ